MSYSSTDKQVEADQAIIADLRSDTVTKPSAAMREAIANAVVGDDVYGEDPTVIELEQTLANRLGKEAAIFLPSGTQSNLIALMSHCGRGDEALVGQEYHIYCYEAGGASVLGSISLCSLKTEAGGEVLPETIRAAIKADDPHFARSRLLSLENTVGGKAIPLAKIEAAATEARAHGLAVHMDGARFFNAVTALQCEPVELASLVDSVSVCLSKGLGTPAGSVLVGSHDFIQHARRHRKILGGGMRQVGMLAAAGLHALQHHITGLQDDHRRAAELAQALRDCDLGEVSSDTNMVFLDTRPEQHDALLAHMNAAGVIISGRSPIRMVLHRDIDDTALQAVIAAFRDFLSAE